MAPTGTRIQLCGHLRVEINGQRRDTELRGRQPRLVFAYLALNRDRPVRREELFNALSDGNGPAPGERVLAPILSRVRRALAPATIERGDSLTLQLPEPAWIDVEAARDALERARAATAAAEVLAAARAATEQTAAGLLADLDAPWLTEPREQLRELRLEALELVAVAAAGVDPSAAEQAARAAVALAPFRESARAALIGALRASGNVAEALRAYDDISALLRDELGTTPGPALAALQRDLTGQREPISSAPPINSVVRTLPKPPPRPPAPDLVEREAEFVAIDGALATVALGAGGLVVFEGPAGIGKTALLRALNARAGGGAHVLEARASLLEREYGFGIVRQLFAAVGDDEVLTAGPAQAARTALSDAGTGEGTFPVLNGLYQLTANLAASGPVVLSIDDLQWSDLASLRFIAYLVRRIATLPVLVAATLRTGESLTDAALLAEIVQDPIAITLRPNPLTVAAVADLVHGRLGAPAQAGFAAACEEVTAGNPLLVRQLLAALAAEHGASVTSGAAPGGPAATGGVGAISAAQVRAIGSRAASLTVLPRLERMSPDVVAVARAVAVLGDEPGPVALSALAGIDEIRAVDAIDQLARTDILRADGPLGFVHPLVRDAVYADMSSARRGLEHARAARLLSDLGASPERIAAQLLLAPPRGDAWVVGQLRAAADVAMRRGAPDAALTLLERAQAEPPPEDQRAALALQLGGSAAYVRGPAGVEPLRRAYEELSDPVERGRAAIRLSHLLLFVRSPHEGVAVALKAAEELTPQQDDLRQGLMAVCLVGAAFGAVEPAALPARAHAPTVGDGPGARALMALAAFTTALACDPAADASAHARAAFAGEGMLGFELTAPVALAIAALTLGDPAEGLAAIDRYTAHARAQGEILGSIGADLWGGFAQILAGDLPAAIASLERAQEGERLWGTKLDAVMGYSSAFLAWAWLESGDPVRARTELHRVEATEGTSDGARFWLAASAELLLAEGSFAAAIAITERLQPLRPAAMHPIWAPWRSLRARALHASGDDAAALALVDEELELARRIDADWMIGRSLRLRGELKGADGTEDLRAAVRLLDGSSAGLEREKARAALERI